MPRTGRATKGSQDGCCHRQDLGPPSGIRYNYTTCKCQHIYIHIYIYIYISYIHICVYDIYIYIYMIYTHISYIIYTSLSLYIYICIYIIRAEFDGQTPKRRPAKLRPISVLRCSTSEGLTQAVRPVRLLRVCISEGLTRALFIIRGGVLMTVGKFPGMLSQRISVGIIVVWRLGVRPIHVGVPPGRRRL